MIPIEISWWLCVSISCWFIISLHLSNNRQKWGPRTEAQGDHSNITELRIRVNKNIEKGSDFGHWALTLLVDFQLFRHKGYPF